MRKHQLKLIPAVLALCAPMTWAASPASGDMNDTTFALAWDGSGPYVLPNLTPAAGDPVPVFCDPTVPQVCDVYTINVNFSDEFRELPENQRESVRIGIEFPLTTGGEDYDLYVYDAAGNLIGNSGNLVGIHESVSLPLKALKNGAYSVTVIPFLPLATNYNGVVELGKGRTPAKALSIAPQVGNAPLTVSFDARSLNADAPAGGYTFDFGDGSAPVSDADGLVEHTYTADGQFLSRVSYADPSGQRALANAAQPVVVGALTTEKSGGQFGGAFGFAALLGLFGLAALRRRAH